MDFVIYPERTNPIVAKPPLWSVWGTGCVGPDGCFYSAMGDHGGPDGETIIYQLDPEERAIRRVFSFQALMGHKPGDWGYGKIHGWLCADREGWIYFGGYWGNRPEEKDLNERYVGGVVARYNIYTGIAEHFGSPVPGVSWYVHDTDTERGLMYLLGTDNSFACYDLNTRQLKYHGSQDIQYSKVGLIVDTEKGMAYFSANSPEGVRFARYDPTSNTVSLTGALIPGNGAAYAHINRRAADGCFYCMTPAGRLSSFNPETEEVEDLGWNFAQGIYTFGPMGLSPGGRYIYYVPGAHGTAWEIGTPIVQYDTKARQRKVLAFLTSYYRSKYDYRFGGTHGISISADGSTLFIPMNGSALEGAGEGQALSRSTRSLPSPAVESVGGEARRPGWLFLLRGRRSWRPRRVPQDRGNA